MAAMAASNGVPGAVATNDSDSTRFIIVMRLAIRSLIGLEEREADDP
jgi:hypothetical protein